MTAYLVSLVSLMFLTFFVFWLYPDYRADALRYRMNRLKDELSELNRIGIISSEDAAYIMLNRTLNGFISKAEQLTMLQLVALYLFEKDTMQSRGETFSEQLQADIDKLNQMQQEKIQSIYDRMNYQLVHHLAWSSPVLNVLLVISLYLYLLIKNHTSQLDSYKTKAVDRADQLAYLTGQTC